MPVNITVDHLAVETRVSTDSAAPPREPYNTILLRLLSVGTTLVEEYAPEAPDDLLDEAVVLMAGYILEAPPYSRTPNLAFEHSGAKAVLANWHELAEVVVK